MSLMRRTALLRFVRSEALRSSRPIAFVQTVKSKRHELRTDGQDKVQYDVYNTQTTTERGVGMLTSLFLPYAYPHSVGPNYINYVRWQALHHWSLSVNGVLSSTFLLYGVGLGSTEAVATAGAINWVLKDGIGQMGTLVFGKLIGHRFDMSTKTWYILASLKLDLAIALEMSTVIFPQHFLFLGAFANSIKGLAWMAGGSTRSAFNVNFSRNGNIADITAKATSQSICTSLLGNLSGVALASYIGQDVTLGFTACAAVSFVHLLSAYRSVKCVPLTNLNPARLELLADRYIESSTVVNPVDFLPHDPCLHLPATTRDSRFLPRIVVGSQLSTLCRDRPWLLSILADVFHDAQYLLIPQDRTIHLILRDTAIHSDIPVAYLNACTLRTETRDMGSVYLDAHDAPATVRKLLTSSRNMAKEQAHGFVCALTEAGWNMDRVKVEHVHARVAW